MIGKTLSHYKILEQIGAGGMGVVYRAHDERLGRDVALKLLPAETLGSESARRALENEARTASALNHPNICTIHDVGEAEGQFFVAMEYVEGKPLAQLIPVGGLPEEQVMRYGMQIADALAHAEQRGIVHRDLKSANVVVTPEGRAKVLDFGLAQRARKEELEVVTRSKVSIEASRGIAGTLTYMAPEALRGEAADARSDIWALGVVLHEMAAGELPFQGATGFELSAAILRESPRTLPPRVAAALRAVIQRCLAKDPAQRYQRAGEVRAALEATSTGLVAVPAPEPHATFWRNAIFGSAGVLALAALLLALNVGGARVRLLGRAGPPKIESIAVLPLANMSGDPAQEYFADGMTEALITELAQLSGLKKVTSRTSVMLYKAKPKPMPEIAKELGVDAVIEGSVQRAGDKVSITVQLIDPAADRHLWTKAYERDMRDIIALQREVARSIADEIKIKLTSQEQSHLAAARPVNPASHDAYLLGRYHANFLSMESFTKSLQYYQESLRIDPNNALAYSGIAEWNTNMTFFGVSPPGPLLQKAQEAAGKALDLDPQIAEAHLSMAYVLMVSRWDWPGAERELIRALELNPGSSLVHYHRSVFLSAVGRHDEAIAEAQMAIKLDPLSPQMAINLGWRYQGARKFAEAEQQYRKTLDLAPEYGPVRENLAQIYIATGRYAEALAEIQKTPSGPGLDVIKLSDQAAAYAASGQKAEALKILEKLNRLARESYVSPHRIAGIYAALGDRDHAFQWLEKAFEEHNTWMIFINENVLFEPLHDDPRFQALLRRMNFPQ